MERKRDGLVPIREAFGGLDGGGLIPIGDALSGNAYSDRTIWWIRKRPAPVFAWLELPFEWLWAYDFPRSVEVTSVFVSWAMRRGISQIVQSGDDSNRRRLEAKLIRLAISLCNAALGPSLSTGFRPQPVAGLWIWTRRSRAPPTSATSGSPGRASSRTVAASSA